MQSSGDITFKENVTNPKKMLCFLKKNVIIYFFFFKFRVHNHISPFSDNKNASCL